MWSIWYMVQTSFRCQKKNITEKAVWRSVCLTIQHCILNVNSTKTHSSGVTFQYFCRLGIQTKNRFLMKVHSKISATSFCSRITICVFSLCVRSPPEIRHSLRSQSASCVTANPGWRVAFGSLPSSPPLLYQSFQSLWYPLLGSMQSFHSLIQLVRDTRHRLKVPA